MKILFLISGWQVPTSRFRVLQYLPHLRAAGHECVVAPSIPPKYQGFRLIGTRASEWPRRIFRMRDVLRAWWGRYDVVFLERELFSTDFVLLEKLLRRVARKVVLDVDDAIFLQYPKKFDTLVGLSDCVIVGNRLLHEKISVAHPCVVEIPTVVDLERYLPRPGLPLASGGDTSLVQGQATRKPLTIGWTGLASNIPYLEIVAPALRELARRHEFEFVVVAENSSPIARLDLAGVRVRFVPWDEQSEIATLQQFDVGIMPLPDDAWSRYKCGLKLIQYMALRIPATGSPVGANCDIVRHGETGFLPRTTADWIDCLDRMLSDAALRATIGAAGRAEIAARYSLDWAAPKMVETLQKVTAAGSR